MRARGTARGATAAVAEGDVVARATGYVHSSSSRRVRAGEAWRAPQRRGEGAAVDVDVIAAIRCRVAAEESAVARGGGTIRQI